MRKIKGGHHSGEVVPLYRKLFLLLERNIIHVSNQLFITQEKPPPDIKPDYGSPWAHGTPRAPSAHRSLIIATMMFLYVVAGYINKTDPSVYNPRRGESARGVCGNAEFPKPYLVQVSWLRFIEGEA